jgi:hypothetical protein
LSAGTRSIASIPACELAYPREPRLGAEAKPTRANGAPYIECVLRSALHPCRWECRESRRPELAFSGSGAARGFQQ